MCMCICVWRLSVNYTKNIRNQFSRDSPPARVAYLALVLLHNTPSIKHNLLYFILIKVFHIAIISITFSTNNSTFIIIYSPHNKINLNIVGISETWLDHLFDSRSLNIEDYVCCDRGLRHHVGKCKSKYMQGGGVAFYLHTSLSYTVFKAPTIRHLTKTEYHRGLKLVINQTVCVPFQQYYIGA